MKIAAKLILAAVLSLSVGIAAATPLMISELNIIPFPRIPEGPKANFEVSTVYADFEVQEHASNIVSGGLNLNVVNYDVILNVTNHSDFPARLSGVNLVAAENVSAIPSIAGGMSVAAGGGKTGSGCNGFVEGVWLDDNWLNVTWRPDGEWPLFLSGPNDTITTTIPVLPENATETGKWIEGVHLWEAHNTTITNAQTTITTEDYIFVNGTWVDVTGRIRVDNPTPYVVATNSLLSSMLLFDSENYGNYANKTQFDEAMAQRNDPWFMSVMQDVWAGADGFDNYWQPHESRLIHITGQVDVGVNAGLESLTDGQITLYASVSSYLRDREELRTYYENTFATVTDLKVVTVQKTTTGYLYNTVLSENETFHYDQFGVEAFIAPRS
jgi:hypothetical protein